MDFSVKLIAVMQPVDPKMSPEGLIEYCARVSAPANQTKGIPVGKLLKYLMTHKHWSPLEMGGAIVEVECSRAIARQMMRHDFRIQEFSQRYASVLGFIKGMRARLQDDANRQNSLDSADEETVAWWEDAKDRVKALVTTLYEEAERRKIAKEMRRDILPEGLTRSRVYFHGNMRVWYHYLAVREGVETQLEHRLIAQAIREVLVEVYPNLLKEVSV